MPLDLMLSEMRRMAKQGDDDGLREARSGPGCCALRRAVFANNSSIRVSTSMRSGTLQLLHISEYGQLCARFPEKAREVRTGALNTIQAGQVVFIESTAEGKEGHFYDLCEAAQAKQRIGTPLTPSTSSSLLPLVQGARVRIDPKAW